MKRKLVEQLATAMGWDGSESGTEEFLVELDAAVERTLLQVEESHDDGLCLDCISVLARELDSKIQ